MSINRKPKWKGKKKHRVWKSPPSPLGANMKLIITKEGAKNGSVTNMLIRAHNNNNNPNEIRRKK